jgi:Cupin domain
VEGEFEFHVDECTVRMTPGAFVCLPKGALHTFRNTGTATGRLVVTVSPPGDFERFVEEVGQPTTDRTPPPPPPAGPPDPAILEKVLQSCRRNHIDVPPPEE